MHEYGTEVVHHLIILQEISIICTGDCLTSEHILAASVVEWISSFQHAFICSLTNAHVEGDFPIPKSTYNNSVIEGDDTRV